MIATETGAGCLPGSSSKIQASHRDRLAVVYVRQSNPQQVLEHRESTELQYALRRRAIEWGWPQEQVRVIDQDQGHSARTTEGREGFKQLLAEVSLDHVGLVLGIEMSRLARSCRDWHQLLELCAMFGTLLADQEGLYDPRNYNDRLLLGLKGTLSEAELHLLQQRMEQGRLNKARRGELFNHPPIGYVRDHDGRLQIDPDQQVQSVVRLVFDKFEELGSVNKLLRYLVRQEIRLGIRPHSGSDRGELQWRRPGRVMLGNVLSHPLFAGAYTWGRRPTDRRRFAASGRSVKGKLRAAQDCAVFIKDCCPAYITWERYEANLKQLAHNRSRMEARGAVREGPALLKGLLVCGICGYRLQVSYDQNRRPRYSCLRLNIERGEPKCQSLAGRRLDELVARQVLTALEPASLDLSLSAAADIQQQRDQLQKHWQQRLERAGYEAERARRQYQVVEPENRLVARELEARWEKLLAEQRKLQEDHQRFFATGPICLNEVDGQLIRNLAGDIPTLWHSPRTTHADRQQIVRHMAEQVVVTPQAHDETVDVAIHFAGGFISHHELQRPVARYEQLHDFKKLLERIKVLSEQKQTAAQIAAQLNAEGWRPPKRRTTFNQSMVQHLLWRCGRCGRRPRSMSDDLLGKDEWWFVDLAREVGLPHPTLYSWMRRGWVHARQLSGPQGHWILWANAEEVQRLKQLHSCNRDWFNQPQAAELRTPNPRPAT
jgi:DNA invertase Pin-like site-specific DNA recombinase